MGFIYTYYRILIIKCIEFCSRNKLKTKSGFQYLFSGCFVVVTGRFDDCRYRPWGHFGLLDPRRPPKILVGFGNSERPKCKRLSHLRRHSIARADQNSQPYRIRKKTYLNRSNYSRVQPSTPKNCTPKFFKKPFYTNMMIEKSIVKVQMYKNDSTLYKKCK